MVLGLVSLRSRKIRTQSSISSESLTDPANNATNIHTPQAVGIMQPLALLTQLFDACIKAVRNTSFVEGHMLHVGLAMIIIIFRYILIISYYYDYNMPVL